MTHSNETEQTDGSETSEINYKRNNKARVVGGLKLKCLLPLLLIVLACQMSRFQLVEGVNNVGT